jgi:PAS domain S-box-containing protein
MNKEQEVINHYIDEILDASFDGILISDAKAKVIKTNRAYETLSGIKKKEIVGKNLKEMIGNHILKRAVVFEVTKSKMPTTMVHSYDRTGKSAMVTGSPVFDEKGKMIFVVANFRDITEITKMKQLLGYANILEAEDETLYLKADLVDEPDYGILVRNKKMNECLQVALRIAQYDVNVLLLGESGVGKTKLSEIIHKASSRANKPFISINCGSIPENLLESELFGYERGAFSGASEKGKLGQFELADGGTLVLDEISELLPSLQVKLLKVIDEKQILKIGGGTHKKVDVRIMAATNKNLKEMVEQNLFREDLYFRLKVAPIKIPPLRERRDEIPFLIKYFFDRANKMFGTQKIPDRDLQRKLAILDYPGNLRELKNLIERLIVMSSHDIIKADDFDEIVSDEEQVFDLNLCQGCSLQEYMELCEKKVLLKTLKEEKTLTRVAKRLEISNVTLWRKLKKHGFQNFYTAELDH